MKLCMRQHICRELKLTQNYIHRDIGWSTVEDTLQMRQIGVTICHCWTSFCSSTHLIQEDKSIRYVGPSDALPSTCMYMHTRQRLKLKTAIMYVSGVLKLQYMTMSYHGKRFTWGPLNELEFIHQREHQCCNLLFIQ